MSGQVRSPASSNLQDRSASPAGLDACIQLAARKHEGEDLDAPTASAHRPDLKWPLPSSFASRARSAAFNLLESDVCVAAAAADGSSVMDGMGEQEQGAGRRRKRREGESRRSAPPVDSGCVSC